jgi:hypothetical protein
VPPVDDEQHDMSTAELPPGVPKPKSRWLYYSLGALLAFAALCAILFWAGFFLPLSVDYNVKATFSQMPTDDNQLEKWLKVQQGVVSNTVRISREGHTVRASFIMQGSASSPPSFPDLRKACESLGYHGVVSEWEDLFGGTDEGIEHRP